MRSVKTWPRSRSAPSWTSSMARKATSRSRGIASTVETQKRGFGGLIFSSPVISATASAPTRSTHLVVDLARQQPQRQPDHAGRMRRACARWRDGSCRCWSGPSTAVTPAPRRRPSRVTGDENEMGITFSRLGMARFSERARLSVSQCDAGQGAQLSIGTSLERIAPESLTPALYGFVHRDISASVRRQPQHRVANGRFRCRRTRSNR